MWGVHGTGLFRRIFLYGECGKETILTRHQATGGIPFSNRRVARSGSIRIRSR